MTNGKKIDLILENKLFSGLFDGNLLIFSEIFFQICKFTSFANSKLIILRITFIVKLIFGNVFDRNFVIFQIIFMKN